MQVTELQVLLVVLSGQGFATGLINLGEIEVAAITTFEFVWGSHLSHDKSSCVSFYKPVGIPEGFFCFGHYCQPNSDPLNGYVLVAKYVVPPVMESGNNSGPSQTAAFMLPVDYTLVWISDDGMGIFDPRGYFWLPEAPPGYKPLGFLVTNKPRKPDLYEVRCVREDLTDKCEIFSLLLETESKFQKIPFRVEKIRPCDRGMHGKGVSVGTFTCSSSSTTGRNMPIACLKNLDPKLHAMPTLVQIHALIQHYGPTIFFHPNELYLPCSVSWFFKNGALLFKAGQSNGEPIDAEGSNLPSGGTKNDEVWIDLPNGVHQREIVKRGDLDGAEVYVHVKPALGGTFTDLAIWIFCPFNGPGTLKIGPTNIAMAMIGEHVGDWEHFTLRLSNFSGELDSIYLSQHSGGVWIRPWDLEFIEENRAVVYSSRSSHACFPHPGTYLQGSSMFSLGVRNDCARSSFILDCSTHYKIIAVEYLGESGVVEPSWLQFMGGWGPKFIYDSRVEFDKIIARLPYLVQFSVASLLSQFPTELFGEEGPTGPKEKGNWVGDERW